LREIREDCVVWTLRNNDKRVLSLPSTPVTDPTRPWRLFQSLKVINKENWLSVEGAPSIINPDCATQWGEDNLQLLLDGVDSKQLFSESALLDYFVKFLDQSAGPYLKTGTVNKQLGDTFRKGLILNGEEVLGSNQQRIRDVIGHLDEKRCFRIDNQLPKALLKRLLFVDIDVVLIPARFYPAEWTDGGSLSVNGAAHLLRKVQDALNADTSPSQDFQKAALNLSEKIIKGVEIEDRKTLLHLCSDLNVLSAFDCNSGKLIAVSLQRISNARDNDLLFGYSQSINQQERLGLAIALQKVLPQDYVLLVNAETAKLAFDQKGAMPQCNGSAVLRTLGQKARNLGELKARAELAGQVSVPNEDIEIRGLRFLLHANISHFINSDDALWILGEEQHPVWRKLWAQLVEDEHEPWNLLKGSIADSLSRDVARLIRIKEIQSTAVVDEIGLRGCSMIDSSCFNREECDQILRAIKDDDLWCTVPFHWTQKGSAVRGDDENVYLEYGDLNISDELLQNVNLILCSQDNEVAHRQKALLRPLDQTALIEILLGHAGDENVWISIMDTMQVITNPLSNNLVEKIKSSAWVPTIDNAPVAPDDIIYLEAAEVEMERILGQAPNTFTTPSKLRKEFQEHSFYMDVRDLCFAHGQEGLERLALVLTDLEPYQVGEIKLEDEEELLKTAQFLSSYEHFGWRLLAKLSYGEGNNYNLMPLVYSMNGLMGLESTVSLLNWVATRGDDGKQAVRVFNRYLKVFSRHKDAKASIRRLKLLNIRSKWHSSEELVSGVVGVSATHVLHKEQADILADIIFQGRPSDDCNAGAGDIGVATRPEASAGIVRDYFQLWSGRVVPTLTGVIVLLFGADESIKALCREMLGQHSREWLINQLPWKTPDGIEAGGAKTWLYGYSLEKALNYFQMTVRVHDAEYLHVQSILGQLIKVGLEEKFSSLFVGRPNYTHLVNHEGYRVDLVLRKIPIEQCSDKQLSSYLQESTTYLMREVFNQAQPRLDTLWNELDKSDQVDIELARALILQNIPFYLIQLGAHRHPKLRDGLNRYRDDERREKEFAGKPDEQKYKKSKENGLADLQRIIETDEGAQQAILESVRHKIRDFQYQIESIPFELFQNADDSLHDLELIDAYPSNPGDLDVDPLPSSICRFIVEASEDQIKFFHWGRAINQFGSKGYPGRELGYDRDLENMLILSASDKGEDVTGKFGLGFKSVWLASDHPTVVSGRLQAEIAGGLLPVPTQNAASQYLRKRMSELQKDNHWPGTGIELPLVGIKGADVVGQFSNLAGVMVAFARNIKSIEITENSSSNISANWLGTPLPGCENIYIGHVHQTIGDLLVLKIVLADGAILIPFGPQGFVELPKEIPNIWVTAPIKEQERLGYAINAMFEVDAGRSRLSASLTENKNLSIRVGKQLSVELENICKSLAFQWEQLATAMQFSPELEPYHFWDSLWKVLLARLPQLPRESGSRVITTSLLSEGFHNLSVNHEIVPNGLPGNLNRLIRSTQVKTVLKDALMESNVLLAVAKTSCFKPILDTTSAVTSERATWLKILIPDFASSTTQWKPVNLSNLIVQLDYDKAITASDAGTLGGTLNTKTLEGWQQSDQEISIDQVKDLKYFIEKARGLRFHDASGSTGKTRDLVTNNSSEDETMRWAFAPDKNRLSIDYKSNAIAFFLLCRDKLDAPSETLKDWILLAEDKSRRCAGLDYLINGELASQVADSLHRSGMSGTWLNAIDENSEYLIDWDPVSRAKLIYQVLKTPEESRIQWLSSGEEEPIELEPIDAKEALTNIYDWWQSARDEELESYRLEIYPEAQQLRFQINDEGVFDRSSWLILLLLGGFHTMGRTLPRQHRKFVENCIRRGWWDVFTDPKPVERFNDWMGVLDQYIDQQVDQQHYEQWMMRFPIIYKLSRKLDDYAELILGMQRYTREFDMESVLTPLTDSDQQGGGFECPPLVSTLGMGANFVVRELIRHRVMDSKFLRKHAYVPYQCVRRLFNQMGCDEVNLTPRHKLSPLISDFTEKYLGEEKAGFCGDFDIPLRIVAENLQLQNELLGRALSTEEEF
jgi:hypothetical protein